MQQHSIENNSSTCDLFRDGCKTIMSILVILTNDCGKIGEDRISLIKIFILETNCDRLTSDDRFFSNLFRLLVFIEKSSFTSEDKFDTLALVSLFLFFYSIKIFFLDIKFINQSCSKYQTSL